MHAGAPKRLVKGRLSEVNSLINAVRRPRMAKGYWIVRIREAVSTADVVIVEGYEGPQPV